MVGRGIRPRAGGSGRCNVEDMSRMLSLHNRQRCFGEQEWPTQIDADYLVPLLNCHFVDRDGMVDCGTVHDDIYTSELFVNCLDGAKDGICVADIALQRYALDILRREVLTD